MNQAEANQLRMPELQRADGVSAEGDYSVSSISSIKMAQKPVVAPQFEPQSITKDLPFNIRECHNSYGPGPSQGAQAIWVKKWSHAPPGFPEDWSILALGGCSNPHRLWTTANGPRTIGHQKGQRTHKPKRH
ncbi:hypothetical protein O181_023287 [Austropuccinia psidii MF-1]|uniref:Uncharacterized protein n=1 Tax=Austropuccinia psidii MF-1 TaxID=1389203 RepID=A0A9Q3CJ85_9BASI|nr:hypothetical protein [Austropuccinia psidii MF-1]